MNTRDRVAAAYDEHYDAMRFVASRQFRVPDADVPALIHDVFVRFMRHRDAVTDDAAWLVTATRNACLNYWRDRKPTTELPAWLTNVPHDAAAYVDLVRVLAKLSPRCREILWLRYMEDQPPDTIARRFCKSPAPGYGRLMIHRCLTSARKLIARTKADS